MTTYSTSMKHCSHFCRQKNSRVIRGDFIDRSLHPTLREKKLSASGHASSRNSFQTFLITEKDFFFSVLRQMALARSFNKTEKDLTAAIWLQILYSPLRQLIWQHYIRLSCPNQPGRVEVKPRSIICRVAGSSGWVAGSSALVSALCFC